MYYDDHYENYYDNYSEFDRMVTEFTTELKKSVISDMLEEMKALKAENEELQEIKEFREKFEYEHRAKMQELEKERSELGRTRLVELLKPYCKTFYTASIKYEKLPKCVLCDDNRDIVCRSADGSRETTLSCRCNRTKSVYSTKEKTISSLQITTEWNKFNIQFAYKDDCEEVRRVKFELLDDSVDFSTLEAWSELSHTFATEELCQKYCDFLNEREENKLA